MDEARAIWAGPGARRVLHRGGEGTVEIALRPGGYASLPDGGWLLFAPPRAPRGPLTLTVAGLERVPPAAGERVRIDEFALVLGTRLRVTLGPELGSDPAPAAAPLRRGWRAALAAAVAAAPAPADELAPGLAALRRGDASRAVAQLAGRGPGLTPAGDDVLAGFAAWRHAAGAAVRFRAERCSPLGRAYLRCAERGELPGPVERVVRAIRAGDPDTARRGARALSGWGASSGAAILWGVAAAASP
jgi:hypothetical protein